MLTSLLRPVTAVAALALVVSVMPPAVSAPASAGSPYRLLMADTGANRVPIRWNPCQEAITYVVNTRYAREKKRSKAAARTRARAEIIRAMGEIAEVTGLPLKYGGTTTKVPTGDSWYDRQGPADELVIAYADQGIPAARSSLLSGAWGQGGQAYFILDDVALSGRGHAVFDADKAVKLRAGFGPGLRRGNLVLHELGHVFGLDHVSVKSQLMHPEMSDQTPDGFASGDIAGLRKLGTAAGCITDAAEFWPGS